MQRDALERLSKAELIELVSWCCGCSMQQPEKTSRTSSKPPSTDRKERREQAKPGGAKPGHAGHSRTLSDDVSERVAHRPEVCPCCRMALAPDLPAKAAGIWECIELPAVRPPERGVEVGEAGIGEDRPEPIAQEQVGVAAAERRSGDAGGAVGHRRERRLRAVRSGRSVTAAEPQATQSIPDSRLAGLEG